LKKNLKGICPDDILDQQLFNKTLQKKRLARPTLESIVEIAKGKKRVKTITETDKEPASGKKTDKAEKGVEAEKGEEVEEVEASDIYSASESDDERVDGESNEEDD
jgi:hypothetical protein